MPTDSPSLRIALYGDINANVMDGSSIWLRNITKLCCGIPHAHVDLFLKAPIKRWHVLDELSNINNVNIIEPTSSDSPMLDSGISPSAAVGKIIKKDREISYTAIIMRGMKLCLEAAQDDFIAGRLWAYLTDIPQSYEEITKEGLDSINRIIDSSQYFLCQTEEMRNFLGNIINGGHHKLVILPPMVPNEAFIKEGEKEKKRIFYSGKFAPAWAVDTLVDLTAPIEGLKVTVAGDKFHQVPGDPDFKIRLEKKFNTYDHVDWLGAITPNQVYEQLSIMQIGFAWRQSKMNASLELSTKLLEYGAAGLAVITNPTLSHKALLGEDYPFFAADEKELDKLLRTLPYRSSEIKDAGNHCKQVARQFSFEALQPRFNRLFQRVFRRSISKRKLKVVLAGHDLKFSRELINYFNSRVDIELKIDRWKSLREHDVNESKKLANWADIVFCEWCAGNSVWYSENIDPSRTKLFIRFHRVEILMEFAPKVRMEFVENIFFVGPHFLRQAKEKFGWPDEKLSVLPNFVDTEMYNRPKFKGAEFNLGLIGSVPRLKRLDRALDILKELRKKDDRYTLFIKGRFPWEYPWVWRKGEEREFYEECFRRIKEEEELKGSVVFDPFGSDVALWLRKIGVILSVSELESFHMALAEGVASGAYPLLWEREGIDELFPWIHSDACAKSLANRLRNKGAEGILYVEKIIENYDMKVTERRLDSIIY